MNCRRCSIWGLRVGRSNDDSLTYANPWGGAVIQKLPVSAVNGRPTDEKIDRQSGT